jgi:hypothetical protein
MVWECMDDIGMGGVCIHGKWGGGGTCLRWECMHGMGRVWCVHGMGMYAWYGNGVVCAWDGDKGVYVWDENVCLG